jgi:hypothetical protein
MTDVTPTSPTTTPKDVAALRARLLAEAAAEGPQPTAAPLCPTVKHLLESRRRERQVIA